MAANPIAHKPLALKRRRPSVKNPAAPCSVPISLPVEVGGGRACILARGTDPTHHADTEHKVACRRPSGQSVECRSDPRGADLLLSLRSSRFATGKVRLLPRGHGSGPAPSPWVSLRVDSGEGSFGGTRREAGASHRDKGEDRLKAELPTGCGWVRSSAFRRGALSCGLAPPPQGAGKTGKTGKTQGIVVLPAAATTCRGTHSTGNREDWENSAHWGARGKSPNIWCAPTGTC